MLRYPLLLVCLFVISLNSYVTGEENDKPCANNSDCMNGGNCDDDGICSCRKGTSGPLCEVVEECIQNPDKCGSGTDVECVLELEYNTTECVCTEKNKWFDYSQKRCAKPCQRSPDNCGKYGRCSSNAFCWCVDGVSGDRCETIDQCASGEVDCSNDPSATCTLGVDGAYCKCSKPYQIFDKVDRTCKGEPCTRDSDCLYGGNCTDDGTCRCPKGTDGPLCQDVAKCNKNPDMCGTGTDAKCVFNPEYETVDCKCVDKRKWFDHYYKKCAKPCQRYPDSCGKYGRCSSSAFCWCVDGVSGDRCETIDQCASGEVDCSNDPSATCTLGVDGAYCKCSKPYQIFDKVDQMCKGEPCKSDSDCLYGGNCTDDGTCQCPKGTDGPLCQEVAECMRNPDKCGTGTDVKCVFDPEYETTECACDDKRKWFDHYYKRCAKPCNSYPDNCGKYGRCSGRGFCWCISGVSGDRCETIDQCASGEVDCSNDPSATCSLGIDGAYCKCSKPYQIFDEEEQVCKG